MQLDPITFEVLRNALGSMCDEGSEMIARLAYAPTISEGHDHSCALLTAEGRLVAHGNRDQAPHIGSFEPSVRVVKEWVGEFEPGDIYIFNDPYTGGIHCNDVKLIRPIHHEGRLVAFNSSTGHWPDVGGRAARQLQPARGGLLLRGAADAADAALPQRRARPHGDDADRVQHAHRARAHRRHPRPATGPVR